MRCAQLAQEGAEAKRQCLACVKQIETLTCAECECDATKSVSAFAPPMLTPQTEAAVCLKCQARALLCNTQARAGWFTCRGTCKLILPVEAASNDDTHRCLNCADQSVREKDLQTCRSCGAKF